MVLVSDNDVYKRERKTEFTNKETITLKQPKAYVYEKAASDWYMAIALEKVDKVTKDRHLLTVKLILSYRWAIREGFNHQLDSALKNRYDRPRNRNTVKGIQGYVERIKKASDTEMENLEK